MSDMFNFCLFVLAAVVESTSSLIPTAKGMVTFFNKSGKKVLVKTYNEKDWLQWVAYENKNVGSNAVAFLQARGTSFIHVYVEGHSYTPKLGKAYEYDGKSLVECKE